MQDINLIFKHVSGKAHILWKKKTFCPWIIVCIVKFFVKGKEYACFNFYWCCTALLN